MAALTSLFDLSNYASGADRNAEIERMIREGIITPLERNLAEGGTERGYNIDWQRTPTIAGTNAHIGDDGPGGVWRPIMGDQGIDPSRVVNDPNWGSVTQSGNARDLRSSMDWWGPLLVGGIAGLGAMGYLPAAAGAAEGAGALSAADAYALAAGGDAATPFVSGVSGAAPYAGTTGAGWSAADEIAALSGGAAGDTAMSASAWPSLSQIGTARKQIGSLGSLLGGGAQGGGGLLGGGGGGGGRGGDSQSFVKLLRSYYGLA